MVRKGENIYKRKDGRWEGRYIKARKADGRIHYGYLYAATYQKVKHQVTLMKALHQESYCFPDTVRYKGTLTQWGNYWLTTIRHEVKPSTFSGYTHKLKQYVFPYFKEKMLGQVMEKDLIQWLHSLQERLSPNSIRVVAQVFHRCLGAAVEQRILLVNPLRTVVLPKGRPTTVSALTKKEQTTLQAIASQDPKGLPTELALETGLRIGELSALRWSDIDFNARTLHVKRTCQRIQQVIGATCRTQLVEGSPKSTASCRVIPLSTKMYHRLCEERKRATGRYLFGGHTATEPRVLTYWFKRISQKIGLAHVRFHALRHTFATRCMEKRVPITTISALLGHHSVKLTLDTYTNTFLSEKRKAIQAISQ